MDFLADTAKVSELRLLAGLRLSDGVTTNPSRVARSGRKMAEVIAQICAITPSVVVKVTLTEDGLAAWIA